MDEPPVLDGDESAGVDLSGIDRCVITIGGDNLSLQISAEDVTVHHPASGTDLNVRSARAVPQFGGWLLLIVTESLARIRAFTDTDEVEVTVTDPETGLESDPPAEVVIYEDELPLAASAAKSARGKTKKTAAKKAKPKAKAKVAKKAKKK